MHQPDNAYSVDSHDSDHAVQAGQIKDPSTSKNDSSLSNVQARLEFRHHDVYGRAHGRKTSHSPGKVSHANTLVPRAR